MEPDLMLENITIKDRVPYTYLITDMVIGKRYYGSSYRKGCHPSDLGGKYTSSSKVMKGLYKERGGSSSFVFEVKRIFDTPREAIAHEATVLRRLNAATSDRWYNRSNGSSGFVRAFGPMSQTHKNKISRANKGHTPHEWSIESKTKLSKTMSGTGNPVYGMGGTFRGKKHSNETLLKMSESANARTPRAPFSKEACDNMKKSKMNQPPFTEEHRNNMRLSAIGRKMSKESIEKRTATRARNKLKHNNIVLKKVYNMNTATTPQSYDKKKILSALRELSDSMTRCDAERDMQKEKISAVAEDGGIEKKILRKMARAYHKQNFTEEVHTHETFQELYEQIVETK